MSLVRKIFAIEGTSYSIHGYCSDDDTPWIELPSFIIERSQDAREYAKSFKRAADWLDESACEVS